MMVKLECVSFVRPDEQLGRLLLQVARQIFSETFASHYEAEPFEAFCDRAYSVGGTMDCDLGDSTVSWNVAVLNNKPIGYAKLTPLRAPALAALPQSLELQQIYVLQNWQGRGVAQQLMDWACEMARKTCAPELYLTVFDHNERAKAFYARNGFSEVGRCDFQLGARVDDDRIWCKSL